MSIAAADSALKQAARKYQGYLTTPIILEGVKDEFVRIMRTDFGVDLRGHLCDFEVFFDRHGQPCLNIDLDLLKTTVH